MVTEIDESKISIGQSFVQKYGNNFIYPTSS